MKNSDQKIEFQQVVAELVSASQSVIHEYHEKRLTLNRIEALENTSHAVMDLLDDDVKVLLKLRD